MSFSRIFSSPFRRLSGALLAFVCAGTYLIVPVDSASAAVPIAQYVSTQETYDGVPNNYAINLAEGSSAADVQAAARIAGEQGGVVLTQYPQFASLTVQAAQARYAQKLAQALASAGIRVHSIAPTHEIAVEDSEIVVPDAQRGHYIPLDDAIAGANYGPDTIGVSWVKADEALNVDVPLEPVRVAVIDSGIAGTHEKLRGKVDYSRSVNCASNGKPFALTEGNNDTIGHGTHVAGIIASDQEDRPQWAPFGGVAPKNVTLVDIKIFNKEDSAFAEDLVCAYTWAAEHDIDITNASLGDFWNPNSADDAAQVELLRRSVAYASQKGTVHVASAGNNDVNLDSPTTFDYWDRREEVWKCNVDIRNNKAYPAMFPDVVNVSSAGNFDTINHSIFNQYSAGQTGCGHEVVSASNWGENSIDVTAPGFYIYSTFPRIPNDGYEEYSYMSGTSMAAPHVAGVLALLKGIHPDYSPQQLRELLYKHAEQTPLEAPSDGKEYRGHGMVNALLAVTKDQPKPSVTVEYSTDSGKTWKKLQGATVEGKIDVRVRVTGPVTRLVVTGAGTGSANGDGSFSTSAEVRFSQTVTKNTPADQLLVDVKAYGRNNDARADDDVSMTVIYASPYASSFQAVYRLYNKASGEHLYSTDKGEYDALVARGWTGEGVAWYAPSSSSTPVYRLFNPATGDHHYVADRREIDALTSRHGWVLEGDASGVPVALFYSDDDCHVELKRLFMPGLAVGSHLHTADMYEYQVLQEKHGWKGEGVSFYALALP